MAQPVVASFREFLKGGAFVEAEQPLSKHGRHIVGALSRNGGIYFVKLEAEPGKGWAAPSLLREITWGIGLGRLKRYSFNIPEIIEHGLWEDRHYMVSRHVDGVPLVAKFSDDPSPCITHLDRLVEIAVRLVNLSPEPFAAIPENGSDAQAFIAKTQGWFDQINEKERFADLMEAVLEQIAGCFVPWPNHGDFTTWHIRVSGDRWYLIDAEHASSTKPKWYDVVYFAHRLATQCNGFEAMKRFFRRFHDALEPTDQEDFYHTLYPLMASRIIGGIWDAQNDRSDPQPHYHLVQVWRNREL